MAAKTSNAVTGNLSAGGSWVGGAAPVAGDTITIVNGAVITVDVSIQLGSNAGNVGHAVTINGASNVSFGTLIVADGVTLTLQGNDRTSNTWLSCARFGTFAPAPGAIIEVDAASDAESLITNAGIINAVGTAQKEITWRSAVGNRTWNTAGSFVASSAGPAQGWYNSATNVTAYKLNAPWISNAAGTGLGAFGDTSLSFSSVTPGTALATEVATLEAVNGIGKYFVDYGAGVVFFYLATLAAPAFTANYKKLTFNSGTIHSVANTTYNEAIFKYCRFQYMGELANADTYLLFANNKQSDAVSGNNHRKFTVEHCHFDYCKRPLGLKNVTGTVADPIVVNDNDFGYYQGDATGYGGCIGLFRASTESVSLQRNIGRCYADFITANASSAITHTSWVIRDNAWATTSWLVPSLGGAGTLTWPDCVFERNFLLGYGGAGDSREITAFGGTAGHEAIVQDSVVWRTMRVLNYQSHEIIRRNVWSSNYHHGVNGPASTSDIQSSNIRVQQNIFLDGSDGAYVEFGYNRRQWADDVTVEQNTMVGHASYANTFVDSLDNTGPQLVTKMNYRSNIFADNSTAVRRAPDIATFRGRECFAQADYNLLNGNGTDFSNFNRFASFTKGGVNYNTDATRNVLGATLFDPLYSAPFSGKSLTLTYTSATNQTLTWDGGAAVQLVITSGTATAGAANTLTDSGKSFPTAQNNASAPLGNWVRITGGTGSGQTRWISNNTATVLTVTPAWTTPPDATSTYTILSSEAQLFDSGATNYVRVGIDWRDLPTSTQTDAGIGMDLHGSTVDPQFVDDTRDIATWDASLGGPGTETAAIARIFADPTLTYSSLLPYLQEGFRPQNAVTATAGYDGGQVGAVAYQAPVTPGVLQLQNLASTMYAALP